MALIRLESSRRIHYVNETPQVIFYWTYVARHICSCFDSDASLQPQLAYTNSSNLKEEYQIALSNAQEAQIRDIFDLQHDGGGTIDRSELHSAKVALGFC